MEEIFILKFYYWTNKLNAKRPKNIICKLRLNPESAFGMLKEVETDYFFFFFLFFHISPSFIL